MLLRHMLGVPPPIPLPPPLLALLHSVSFNKAQDSAPRASLHFSRVILGSPFHLHAPSLLLLIPHLSPPQPSLPTRTPVLDPSGSSSQTSQFLLSLMINTGPSVELVPNTFCVDFESRNIRIQRSCHSPPHFLRRGPELWREIQ